MNESNLLQQIRLRLSELGVTIWRNNCGKLQDRNGRWITYGLCVGSSDLIGIHQGRFLAIEAKVPGGRIRPEQLNFIEAVRKAGGIAGICRSVQDAELLICTAPASAYSTDTATI